MANKRFNVDVDVGGNAIRNVLADPVSADPGAPAEGQIWYNTTSHQLKYRDNGTSQVLAAGSGISNGYANISDGSVVAAAIGADTITFNSANSLLSIAASNGAAGADTVTWTINTAAFDTQVRTSRLDQMAAPTASVSLNNQKIINLLDPSSAQDAATKAYVDATVQGLDVKASVRVASTANVNIAAPGTAIDGVTLTNGDRVLLKDQTTGSQNGIYVFNGSGSAMTRATDADSSAEVTPGMFTFVEEGTTNADSGWTLTTNAAITLGTTALVFAQFSGAGQITAGAGLTKTGNTLDVATASSARIVINADSIDLATAGPGAGTIGLVTLDAYGRVTAARTLSYTATFGDGAATSYTFTQATHGLAASRALIAAVYNESTGDQEDCRISINTGGNGTVTVQFNTAPATNSRRIVILG